MRRTRTKTEVLYTITESQEVTPGPVWSSSPAQKPITYTPLTADATQTSTIIDEDRGWGRFNECRHYSDRVDRSNTKITYQNWDSVSGLLAFSVKTNYRARQNPTFPTVSYFGSDLETWKVPDFSGEAVQAMWPEIEERLSVLNSVYELKDVTRLTNLIDRTLDRLATIGRYLRSDSARPLKDLLGWVANGYLNNEFGIKPLCSDLSNAMNAWLDYKTQVKRLVGNENTMLISHYRRPLSPKDFGLYVTLPSYEVSSVWDRQFYDDCHAVELNHGPTGVPMYSATMSYSYRLADYERENAHVLGLLDSFGVRINPSIIWNAIPWSFVIDWVAKVGNYIDQAKIRNIEPSVTIHKFCHSVRLDLEQAVWISPYKYWTDRNGIIGTFQFGTVPKHKVMSHRRKYYIRVPAVPNFIAGIQGSPVSLKEISLALALGFPR